MMHVTHSPPAPWISCTHVLVLTFAFHRLLICTSCPTPPTPKDSRPDRDDHVEIKWDYVQSYAVNNFAKASTSSVNSLNSPYDYTSIMHYPDRAFSTDGTATIVPTRDFEPWETMGQRARLSDRDVEQLRLLYMCASGPREGGVSADELCSEDCPCWEHALGECRGDGECLGDLVCGDAPPVSS